MNPLSRSEIKGTFYDDVQKYNSWMKDSWFKQNYFEFKNVSIIKYQIVDLSYLIIIVSVL